MEAPTPTAECPDCKAPLAADAALCTACGRPRGRSARGIDWGVVVLVVLLLAIPIGVWQMVGALVGGGEAGDAAPPPASPEAEPARRESDSAAERELRQKLADAEQALAGVRIEAVQSGMTQMWADVIAEKQRRVAEARAELERLALGSPGR